MRTLHPIVLGLLLAGLVTACSDDDPTPAPAADAGDAGGDDADATPDTADTGPDADDDAPDADTPDPGPGGAIQRVDCDDDPAWSSTLFCAGRDGAVDYARPTLGPQSGGNLSVHLLYSGAGFDPATESPFPAPGQARCVDGTEPFFWLDRAEGEEPGNRWVFVFQGGGSCYGNAVPGSTADCTQHYGSEERREMTGGIERGRGRPQRTVGGGGSSGILDPRGPFADFHRVRIGKCSYDRYMGDRDEPLAIDGSGGLVAFHQGLRVAKATLSSFAGGETQFRDCTGDACEPSSVPPLCDPAAPDTIVLAGHSGGAHGLYFNAYALRDHLETLGCSFGTGPDDDKLVTVHDAQFLPMLDAACHSDPDGCDCEEDSIYCHDRAGQSDWFMSTYDDDFYAQPDPASPYRQNLVDWNRVRPESLNPGCVAANPDDLSPCLDRFHVAANYFTEIPFVLRESLADTNPEHHRPGLGHPVFWANDPDGGWNDDDWIESGVVAIDDPESYARIILLQAEDMVANHADRAAGGPLAPFHIHLPHCGDHGGILGGDTFASFAIEDGDAEHPLEGRPYGEVLRAFVAQIEEGEGPHSLLADDTSASDSSTCSTPPPGP